VSTPDIPAGLARHVVATWGEAGRAWLADVPGLLGHILGAWL